MRQNKIYLLLVAMILVGSLISCGVNRTAGCDAYGQGIQMDQNQDLAIK